MNREKLLLQAKLGENTKDHVMHINIDGPSLDNFETENLIILIEFTITLRHLNGHNSSRTEAHEEADENVIVL